MIHRDVPAWALPESEKFSIRDTDHVGRAVFAQKKLEGKTLLLSTSEDQSPLAHVILRPYRREVCAWCFAYDRGRDWKIRDPTIGTAFCSDACRQTWASHNTATCQDAAVAVEAFTKGLLRRPSAHQTELVENTETTTEIDSDGSKSVSRVWDQTYQKGIAIRGARKSTRPTKPQRAALRAASELSPDPDILAYTLSGCISAFRGLIVGKLDLTDENLEIDARALLPSLFELTPDDHVFRSNPMTPSPLRDYTSAYLVLMAVLPNAMLNILTPDLIINLASRAAHNAFSIRPEGTSDGEQSGEFLGWGVWPPASFFNHSCSPNVRKERIGRLWSFYVGESDGNAVQDGEQLCITYLGGDEKDLDVVERRKRLKEQWGFLCMCTRCIVEAQDMSLES